MHFTNHTEKKQADFVECFLEILNSECGYTP